MKKKLIETLVDEVSNLTNEKLIIMFSNEISEVPNTEAKANLFVRLSLEKRCLIFNSIENSNKRNLAFNLGLMLEIINDDIKNGEQVIIETLENCSTYSAAEMLYDFPCSALREVGDESNSYLKKMTNQRIIDVVNYAGTNKFEGFDFSTLSMFSGLNLLQKTTLIEGLEVTNYISLTKSRLRYETVKDLYVHTALVSAPKIVEICKALIAYEATKIILQIKDRKKQTMIIKKLPEKHKTGLFKKISSQKQTSKVQLREKDINVNSLNINQQRDFIDRFPKSKKIAQISIEKRIQAMLG